MPHTSHLKPILYREYMRKPTLQIVWRTDAGRVPSGHVAIVSDVLRASTTIAAAFSRGVNQLQATTEIAVARALASEHDALLMGERQNVIIDGFDYGNSPVAIGPELAGQCVIFTSTNFPHALQAASDANVVFIGAPVNCTAVCGQALAKARQLETDITIMLAGEPSEAHAGEDAFFGALAVTFLSDDCDVSEEARVLYRSIDVFRTDLAIAGSVHAQELIAAGFGRDVEFAFDVDRLDTVPVWDGVWISVRQ